MRTKEYYIALDMAISAHNGDDRKPWQNYVVHPLEVVSVLEADPEIPEKVLCAALLHDTIEDGGLCFADIARALGEDVARIVGEVTDDPRQPRWKQKAVQIEKIKTMSYEALCVKLADRLINVMGVTTRTPVGYTYISHTKSMLLALQMRMNDIDHKDKKIHYRHALKIAERIKEAI